MIKFSEHAIKIIDFSFASTTAGTRVTVAHNLGYRPAVHAIVALPTCDDTDTDNAQAWAVDKADNTNVTLKPTRTLAVPTTGTLYIGLEEQGPFNSGRP